jgi:hypothetical protein
MVAKNLGLARDVLAAYRKNSLEKNQDWRIHRKQVEISDAGIKKIMDSLLMAPDPVTLSTALGTSPPAAAPTTAQPAPPANGPPNPEELVELQVVRPYPNPRLVSARTAEGQLVTVAVPQTNKNFRGNMRIKAHPPEPPPAPQVYRLEGRCPRFPGRW